MNADRHSQIVIVQRRLTHYRVPLFESLRMLLQADGVTLRLLHGDPSAAEASRSDEGRVTWAEHLRTRYWADERICWQPFGSQAAMADLVILPEDARLLYNLWALARRRPRHLAMWGDGASLQPAKTDGRRERWQRSLERRAIWWFTNTDPGAERVRRQGFARDQITNVENTTDTRALAQDCQSVTSAELADARRLLGLQGARIGLFLGSLYEDKRIPFLLEAAELVVQREPSFRLLVVGDGPQRHLVEQAARSRPWLRYAGMHKGRDKSIALRLADLMLLPGAVGLAILDGFTAGLPLLTTDCGVHGPEIAYLHSGENGIKTENSALAYSRAVVALLGYEAERRRLGVNAQYVAAHFTIDNMAQRMRRGINAALQMRI